MITRIGAKVAYGVEIPDDPKTPGIAWSLLERETEARALRTLIESPRCVVFLFNELVVSLAWCELNLPIDQTLEKALAQVEFHTSSGIKDNQLVGPRLNEIRAGHSIGDTQVIELTDIDWHKLEMSYITNQASVSGISLFHDDEGGQQEEMAVWLTDNLHPKGCGKSPLVHERVPRELCDILLSYERGAFLIESKALSVLGRENLPDRTKLSKDLKGHIDKAARQLKGGIRNLKNGLRVTDRDDKEIDVARSEPVHAIILVPDLSLLSDFKSFNDDVMVPFMEATGGYLHIIDPSELLRLVQAADMVAGRSNTLTSMEGFDWALLFRAKASIERRSPDFGLLFHQRAEGLAVSIVE